MAYNYQETLKEVDKECYNEKLKVAQLSQCPYKLAEGAWSTDITKGRGGGIHLNSYVNEVSHGEFEDQDEHTHRQKF